MSEQVKLAYLQEKIKDATKKQRSGWTAVVFGLVAAIVGFWLHPLGIQNGIAFGILGIILCSVGFIEVIFYGMNRIKLLKRLKMMSIAEPKYLNSHAECSD